MTRDKEYYDTYSADFKTFMKGLSPQDRQYAVVVIQNILNIKNASNVQLWFTDNANYRRYMNNQLSADDQDLREALLDGLRKVYANNSPQKSKAFTGDAQKVGRKIRNYLTNSYVLRALTSVEIYIGGANIEYDAYTEQDAPSVEDSDTVEFGDVIK